jgi:hypothetical protein
MRWILAGVDAGRIPRPKFTATTLTTVGLQLALEQRPMRTGAIGCTPLAAPLHRSLREGESFGFAHGAITVVLLHNGVASEPLAYRTRMSSRLQARAGPLDLTISPRAGSPVLCE